MLKSKMELLNHHMLSALEGNHAAPCLSIYQPTQRHHPGNQQDFIRFRHLTGDLEHALKEKYPADGLGSLLEPFQALGRDRDFWNHTLDGLAVFGAPGFFRTVGLHRTVQNGRSWPKNFTRNRFDGSFSQWIAIKFLD